MASSAPSPDREIRVTVTNDTAGAVAPNSLAPGYHALESRAGINVTADGTRLWLSGRYDSEVYVFDTTTGELVGRIPTDPSPHGLAVWPQPGRYSLGHTGNTR